MTLHDRLKQESYQISKTVQNTHDQRTDIISSHFIDSMSHDVYTEASKGTANDCLTTSVPSENQTAMLECGQQQGVQTATDDLTEKLDLVSREQDRDCGPEEDVSTCEVLNIHSNKYTLIQQTFCRVRFEINTNVSGNCSTSIIKVLCSELP